MWLHARIELLSEDEDENRFVSKMLQPFDENYDYAPWMRQVTNKATGYYLQRTIERLTTADLLGAEYVAASPFEARPLHHRNKGGPARAPSAAIWAVVPSLRDLTSKDLVKVLTHDEALESLRSKVRAAVSASPQFPKSIDAISDLVNEIEDAASTLEKKMKTERTYSAVWPSILSSAELVIGAAGKVPEVPEVAGAALAALAGVVPYLGSRKNTRREAAFLFVVARQRARSTARKRDKK
jgi:hypothetical protein